MHILVTGAAGFIGSHVTDRLLSDGHRVSGIDNFSDYYNPDFKEENIKTAQTHPNYTLYRSDIGDHTTLAAIFAANHFDAIIHLAAQAGVRVSIEKPIHTATTNIIGTLHLLELCKEFGVQQFIFASSSSVYGNHPIVPLKESEQLDSPISPYAASKKSCELFTSTYHHLYDINCIGLRFFTVYGERGRPDMSPYLFTDSLLHRRPLKKFGDGSMQRDFTYIDDIVDGIVRCLTIKPGYAIINLGNHQPVSLNDYIATLERVTGETAIIDQLPEQPGDVRRTMADISLATQLLDWTPTTDLETGLAKFVDWFRKNRV
jgi:UDP-glucuronate 4-epimerase